MPVNDIGERLWITTTMEIMTQSLQVLVEVSRARSL